LAPGAAAANGITVNGTQGGRTFDGIGAIRGGDTNSTDGSESSHMHTASVVNCNTGYEWQLMQAARARNPAIKLYGLAWGAPGWIGGGNFWSTDMVNYLVSWLNCAKSKGLAINYLGGWNERGYNIGWYEQLRSALNSDGYSGMQIVGAHYPPAGG
jgi:hypothetical protein